MTAATDFGRRRHLIAGLGALGLGTALGLRPVRAATDYPNRPIRIIVPWAAGGGGDVVVRLLATGIGERLGQPVVVDNRGGATGTIGSAIAAKSAADGYTLVYGSADSHSIVPHLYKTLPYDARRDFTAVAPIGFFPYALAVHPSLPARNVAEFVQLAKAAKERLTYGSWGVGSSGQVMVESLKLQAGVDLLHVPYQGTAPLMMGLVAGQVNSAILPMPLVEQHAKTGAIRLLGLTSYERLPGMPDLPTMKEQGVALDSGIWVGFMGPANLPADVLDKIHAAIETTVSDARMQDALRKLYVLPEVKAQPAYQAFINGEYDRWGKIIQAAKITLE